MLSNDVYKDTVNFSFFPNALFPVTSQYAWRALVARLAFGPFRPQCPWRSLGTRGPFASWFPYVAFVSTWSCGSLKTGKARNACWPRGSRVSRHTWNPWRAKAGTITTRSVCWKLRCALHVQRKERFDFILIQ